MSKRKKSTKKKTKSKSSKSKEVKKIKLEESDEVPLSTEKEEKEDKKEQEKVEKKIGAKEKKTTKSKKKDSKATTKKKASAKKSSSKKRTSKESDENEISDDDIVDFEEIIDQELAKAGKKEKEVKKTVKDAKNNSKPAKKIKEVKSEIDQIAKEVDDLLSDEDELSAPDLEESIKAQEEKPREAWKILFSGLDFAGKSSIIATLKREFEKLVNPKPTKLTERSSFSFLGQEINDWDLGGQRLYRIQYLKRPVQYYADTSILFYVIDVLDEERFEEAIDFLYDTLQLFDDLGINPLISILFHKMDPEVEKDAKKNRIELKLTALKNKIKVLTYGRDVLFFRTSIFNQYTVIEAFSKSMLELFPGKNLVDYALAELAQKTDANIIILLDKNRFILGQNIVETDQVEYQELVKLSQNTLLSFLYLNENFKFYPFLKSNYMIIQLEKYSFLWAQIEERGHIFYMIVFKDGASFDDLLEMDVRTIGKTLVKLVKQ